MLSGRWVSRRCGIRSMFHSDVEGPDVVPGWGRCAPSGPAGNGKHRAPTDDASTNRRVPMNARTRHHDRQAPLWSPAFEHDSCGVGLVVDIAGRPSRQIVERALAGLVNLTHRGGVGADSRTGDGAGVLTQIPVALFADSLAEAGHTDFGSGELGVAMTFLPTDNGLAGAARRALEEAVRGRGLEPVSWRVVPTDPNALGEQAIASMPRI